MGVGSLHHPREYDGRLPPDVDYYLDLVIPRFEEPPKQIGSQVRLLHGRVLQIGRSTTSKSTSSIGNISKFTSNISKFTGKTSWEEDSGE